MPEINVDGLLFVFPEGWEVDKFDELAFYRNQFSKQHNNIKAVDLLALERSKKTLWLIEVKYFSCHKRDKTVDLSDEIFGKIISTLAALLPAKVNASKIEEINFAKKAIRASKIRVVIDELIDLLKFIKSFNIELWLWTSFSLEEIPAKIKELCDFIKTGKFIPNQKYYLSEYNIELASPNQKINKKGIDY